MQKPQSFTLEQKLGCIEWDIWNCTILFDYTKHGCFSELRDFLKFLRKSNGFAPSCPQLAHSSTKISEIRNELVAKPRKSAPSCQQIAHSFEKN